MSRRNKSDTMTAPGTRFFNDRSDEQLQFLRSVEKEAPETLRSLKRRVLPQFLEDGKAWHAPRTWSAIWDWAAKWRLVPETEVTWLKSVKAVGVARQMEDDIMYRFVPSNLPETEATSAAVVFGLKTLVRVVLRTLTVWSEPSKRARIRWTFPEAEPTLTELVGAGGVSQFAQTMQSAELRSLIEAGQLICPYLPPFECTIKIPARDVSREAPRDTKAWGADEFEKQWREQAAEHDRIAQLLGHDKPPRKIRDEHFDWLARRQVKGERYAEIARANDQIAQTVQSGIESTAELVIGPSWRSWLRSVKPGRPKRRA